MQSAEGKRLSMLMTLFRDGLGKALQAPNQQVSQLGLAGDCFVLSTLKNVSHVFACCRSSENASLPLTCGMPRHSTTCTDRWVSSSTTKHNFSQSCTDGHARLDSSGIQFTGFHPGPVPSSCQLRGNCLSTCWLILNYSCTFRCQLHRSN